MNNQSNERTAPRISLSKLGEYLTAPPARRRTIVSNQKRPKDSVVAWYREARSAIVAYFQHGDPQRLEAFAEGLLDRPHESEYKITDARNSALAIESFLELSLDIGDVQIMPRVKNAVMEIAGVTVSIAPDIVIEGVRRGGKFRGALKLYIVKDNPLDDESGRTAAAVLRQWVESSIEASSGCRVSNDYCAIVDVFAKKVHRAPISVKRRLQDVNAACEEIALRWNGS